MSSEDMECSEKRKEFWLIVGVFILCVLFPPLWIPTIFFLGMYALIPKGIGYGI